MRKPAKLWTRLAIKTTSVDALASALRSDRSAINARILELQADGGTAAPVRIDPERIEIERAADEILARAGFFDGKAKPEEKADQSEENLSTLYRRSAALGQAIDKVVARQEQERAENQRQAIADSLDVVHDLIHQRAEALANLLRINRQFAEKQIELWGNTSTGQPGARFRLLGTGEIGEPHSFLTELVAAGIITKGEIAKWMEIDSWQP